MIGALKDTLDHLSPSPLVPRTERERPRQIRGVNRLGAGAHTDKATPARRAHGEADQTTKGPSRFLFLGAAVRKLRRINEDQVEAIGRLLQDLLGVLFQELHVELVRPRRLAANTHSDFTRVHTQHTRSPTPRSRQSPCSHKRISIKHLSSAAQSFDDIAKRALIKIEPCLLAELEGQREIQPPLSDFEARKLPTGHATLRLKPLRLSRFHGGAIDDGARRVDRLERVENELPAKRHPNGRELHREGGTESVDDQAGQVVALSVARPIAVGHASRLIAPDAQENPLVFCCAQSLHEEIAIEPLVISRKKAHPNRRLRGKKAAPEKVLTSVDDVDLVAGLRIADDPLDCLCKNPWMPGPNRLHMP